MVERCKRLAESGAFQNAVLGLIIVNAVAMGLETWPALGVRWASVFQALNVGVQVAFGLELAVRIIGHGRRPLEFFRSGWNTFDFAVVALALLPATGSFAAVARLARVLRVARLITGMPELRLIIGTLLRSVSSMGHIVMLLGLLIYVYGVTGHHLFASVDPEHWGSLGRAAQTLFFVITLEGWVEIMRASEAATPWAWLYYLSFIIIAVFVVINLFIAVVINNLENARKEESNAAPRAEDGIAASSADVRAMASELAKLRSAVEDLGGRR